MRVQRLQQLNYRKWLLNSILIAVAFPITIFGNLSEQMRVSLLRDFEVIRTNFAAKYASKDWKKQYKNWDLNVEIKKAKDEIRNMHPLTIKGFQRTVKNFFQSAADYHVGVEFYSTEVAFLPFVVRGAQGRYFVVEIDRNAFPVQIFPAEVGDEILSFEGKSIADAIDELKKTDFHQSIPGTDQALAELALTLRAGEEGHLVPQGKVDIVTRNGHGEIKNFSVHWLYVPELVSEIGSSKNNPFFASTATSTKQNTLRSYLNKQMVYSHLKRRSQLPLTESPSYRMGAKQSYVPTLGVPFWQSGENDTFFSYLFMQSGKRVGYVRIASYMADEKEVEDFRTLIKFMQLNTDMLILDQVNNPGGSLFYVYALASMLSPFPLSTPKHRIALTQEEVMQAASFKMALSTVTDDASAQEVLGKNIAGYPVNLEFAKKTVESSIFLISEWEAGHQVTDPTFLLGFDTIEPSTDGNYTKPILLLINALDFSGGDFFPAIMKDNHRAIILGTRTAGAGGYVTNSSFYNLGGIKNFTLTSSLALTLDQKPLENNGVTPDIVIDLTVNDLQNGGIDLKKAILAVIDSIPVHGN